MVLSLAVVGVVVAATFWMVAWQRPEVQGPIRPAVDVEQIVAQVRAGGLFAVWEPQVTDDWTATSGWFDTAAVSGVDGGVLHLGFLTPAGSYAEVKQTDADAATAKRAWAEGATDVGTVAINGARWQRLESPTTGRQALVLERDDQHPAVTVVVTGKADAAELEQLAASLR